MTAEEQNSFVYSGVNEKILKNTVLGVLFLICCYYNFKEAGASFRVGICPQKFQGVHLRPNHERKSLLREVLTNKVKKRYTQCMAPNFRKVPSKKGKR